MHHHDDMQSGMREDSMKSSVVSEKGHRLSMEDAHVLDENYAGRGWIFGGVFDGHNGHFAAFYSSLILHRLFLDKLCSGLSAADSFIDSYLQVSHRLRHQESGTTAVTFLIREGKITTANVGDARAIVIGDREVRQLTVDHRVNNEEERERILATGGKIRGSYVYRGSIGLMPTRTIGDEYFKPVGIIASPSVSCYDISENDLFLLAACDGLFDVMTNEETAMVARGFTEPEPFLAQLRTDVLVNRRGMDNVTMIAVRLKEK